MRSVFLATCQYCGVEYYSHNVRRLYCSERCRRDFQNDRRAGERAEERELREQLWSDEKPHWMQDPWQVMDAEDAAWDNALLDAAPELGDNPWGGPSVMVGQLVGNSDKLRKRKRKHEGQLMLPGMEAWRS